MLEVIEPGILTTIQDGGRPRAVHLGVPVGGACDPDSLAIANALLGNELTAAAIEMTVLGATFRVLQDTWVGVAGAAMYGGPPPWRSHLLRKGEGVSFGGSDGPARTYLAVPGGVDVPLVLESRSTCLVGGFGGIEGRPLRVGDVIRAVGAVLGTARSWPAPAYGSANVVRVVRGAEPMGFDALVGTEWEVSIRSNRQGIRLDGPPLAGGSASMLSRGVVWGSIQMPPDGQPIVLLADAQTVGGYPVVAVVIKADRSIVGQLSPVEKVGFLEVGVDEARRALREQAAAFERLRAALT